MLVPETPCHDHPDTQAEADTSWCTLAAPVAVVSALVSLIVLAGIVLAAGSPPPTLMLWVSVAPVDIVAFAAALAVLRRQRPPGHRARALELLPRPEPVLSLLGRAARALLFLYPSTLLLTLASVYLLTQVGYTPQTSHFIEMLLHERGGVFWASALGVTLLLAPLAEEILFRLVLFESLSDLGQRTALCLTATAFALVHQIPEQMPALFLLGVVLQRARERSGGLWLPLMTHAGFNAVSVLALLVCRLVLR